VKRQYENIKSINIQTGFQDEDASLLEYPGMSTGI
jgi:hypothetical protein